MNVKTMQRMARKLGCRLSYYVDEKYKDTVYVVRDHENNLIMAGNDKRFIFQALQEDLARCAAWPGGSYEARNL